MMGVKTCVGCKNHLGGGCCRLNEEAECQEGGGYELWEGKEDDKGNSNQGGGQPADGKRNG